MSTSTLVYFVVWLGATALGGYGLAGIKGTLIDIPCFCFFVAAYLNDKWLEQCLVSAAPEGRDGCVYMHSAVAGIIEKAK